MRTLALSVSALLWAAWGAVAVVVMLTSTGWAVPLALVVSVVAAWPSIGRSRTGLAGVAIALSSVLIAVWVLLGVLMRREGSGGRVLWVLPSWSSESGGAFGGPVTTGQLEYALLQGMQGVAVLAVIALLYRAVAADGWLRLIAWVAGPTTGLLAPTACLAEAWSQQTKHRITLRSHGLDLASSRWGDLWSSSQELAAEWTRIDAARHAAERRASGWFAALLTSRRVDRLVASDLAPLVSGAAALAFSVLAPGSDALLAAALVSLPLLLALAGEER